MVLLVACIYLFNFQIQTVLAEDPTPENIAEPIRLEDLIQFIREISHYPAASE